MSGDCLIVVAAFVVCRACSTRAEIGGGVSMGAHCFGSLPWISFADRSHSAFLYYMHSVLRSLAEPFDDQASLLLQHN